MCSIAVAAARSSATSGNRTCPVRCSSIRSTSKVRRVDPDPPAGAPGNGDAHAVVVPDDLRRFLGHVAEIDGHRWRGCRGAPARRREFVVVALLRQQHRQVRPASTSFGSVHSGSSCGRGGRPFTVISWRSTLASIGDDPSACGIPGEAQLIDQLPGKANRAGNRPRAAGTARFRGTSRCARASKTPPRGR